MTKSKHKPYPYWEDYVLSIVTTVSISTVQEHCTLRRCPL